MEILLVEGLRKVYEGKVEALKGVSFTIEKPSLTALLGPNGAGKTTLLNIVVGITPPTSGKVMILGRDPWRDRRVRALVGFVPQEEGIFRVRTVEENLLTIAAYYDVPTDEARRRAKEVMEYLGLTEYRRRLADKLSGGLKRRLAIGMALMHDPKLLVLDEPTTGLDPGARAAFMRLIRGFVREGKAVLMSTHIGEDAELCDDVIIMHRGELVARGSPDELRKKALGLKTLVELLTNEPRKVAEALGGEVIKVGASEVVKVLLSDPEKELPNLMSEVYRLGISVNEVRVRKPSMSDVFIAFTGQSLEEVGGG